MAAASQSLVIIPLGLTTLRLLLGPVACWLAVRGGSGWLFGLILVTGLLSDIYDGVLARRFGVATERLRRYDSLTDLFYYGCILWSAWRVARTDIEPWLGWIAALVIVELAVIAVCLLRFGKMPATHSYGAKFYGLVLFTCFFVLLVWGHAGRLVPVTVAVGLLADAEILLILFLAKTAPVDVKTVIGFQARET
jgi:CDP-diacylglycerol--glycerol-3-phosphate 3-phosphatidyltransferase